VREGTVRGNRCNKHLGSRLLALLPLLPARPVLPPPSVVHLERILLTDTAQMTLDWVYIWPILCNHILLAVVEAPEREYLARSVFFISAVQSAREMLIFLLQYITGSSVPQVVHT